MNPLINPFDFSSASPMMIDPVAIDYTSYLNDILMTLAQIEGVLWFFVLVTTAYFTYRFFRIFI